MLRGPSSWSNLTFENYTGGLEGANMGNAFINSLAITLPATFIPILIAAFAAYAFTFMEFPGRDVLFLAHREPAGGPQLRGASCRC